MMGEIALSPFNKIKFTNFPDRIIIYDSTLRDGEQMPGVAFTPEQKLDIAIKLDEIGIPEIEAGFPAISEREIKTTKKITSQGLKAKILALSRLKREDIDAAIKADVDVILLFIASSPLHLTYKLRMGGEEVKEKVAECIDYAKEHGIIPSFSTEDSTRTPIHFLDELVDVAVNAGAKRIGITDTLGCATPEAIAFLFSHLRSKISLPISAHLHNDFGLALSNAILALQNGATHVCATVHGWGERAGNVPLEQLVMVLQVLYGLDMGIDTTKLKELSELVSRYAKIDVPPNQPFVGDNAFAHESGIHVAAVLRNPRTYECIDPKVVGNKRRIVIGKHSGRGIIEKKLEEMNVEVNREVLEEIVRMVKVVGEKKGSLSDRDIAEIVFRMRNRHG